MAARKWVQLCRRRAPCSRAHSGGFTLIEALAALAIVAITLATIGNLANTTLRSGLHVQRHLAAVETLGALLSVPLDRHLGDGAARAGEMAGRYWRIETSPMGAPSGRSPWALEKVRVTVTGEGAGATLETLHLVKP